MLYIVNLNVSGSFMAPRALASTSGDVFMILRLWVRTQIRLKLGMFDSTQKIKVCSQCDLHHWWRNSYIIV